MPEAKDLPRNLAAVALPSAAQAAVGLPSMRAISAVKEVDDPLVKRLLRRIIPDVPRTEIRPLGMPTGQEKLFRTLGLLGPHYNPVNRSIALDIGQRPGVVAHEIGHALSHKMPLAKARYGLMTAGKGLSALAPMYSALTSNRERARAAAAAGTGLMLPTLGEELLASGIGSKLLRSRGLKGRLAAFMGIPTYLAASAVPWLTYKTKDWLGGYDKSAGDSYLRGFMEKCAQENVDPEKLLTKLQG